MENPQGLALDSSGNIYFVDIYQDRVREITIATGIINTIAGNGFSGDTGDGGPAISAELSSPTSLAIDGSGNIFIDDSYGKVIREIFASTGNITTIAGTSGITGFFGDGGPATGSLFNNPDYIALDAARKSLYFGFE